MMKIIFLDIDGVLNNQLFYEIKRQCERHAEWEIRVIFNQVAELVKAKYPLMFCDANFEMVDGQNEITFKNHKI